MKISLSVLFAGVWLALAGLGNDFLIIIVAALFGLGVLIWIASALHYVRSGKWEIDQRMRAL